MPDETYTTNAGSTVGGTRSNSITIVNFIPVLSFELLCVSYRMYFFVLKKYLHHSYITWALGFLSEYLIWDTVTQVVVFYFTISPDIINTFGRELYRIIPMALIYM